jgi:hypothetical protein
MYTNHHICPHGCSLHVEEILQWWLTQEPASTYAPMKLQDAGQAPRETVYFKPSLRVVNEFSC